MSTDKKRFTVLFEVGAILVIIGLLFHWYPTYVVGGLQAQLDQPGLPIDETNKLQGALNSWVVWQITTFEPLSSVILAVGIIFLVYSVISGVFSVASDYKVAKKEQ
jgi:hypothetical protein